MFRYEVLRKDGYQLLFEICPFGSVSELVTRRALSISPNRSRLLPSAEAE